MLDINSNVRTNSSYWVFSTGTGINDSGSICGFGFSSSQLSERGVLMELLPVKPLINEQPKSQTVAIGSTVNLNVAAASLSLQLSFQWFLGTNAIIGATNATLVITNAQETDAGSYTVTVANESGSVTSDLAVLTILPGLGINLVPAIAIAGTSGALYDLEYANVIGPTNAWVTLATIMVTNNPQVYCDISAIGQPARFYRLVRVP